MLHICPHCGKTFGRGIGGHIFRSHDKKGLAASEEARRKARLVNLGNKYFLGHKHTNATKDILSEKRISNLNKRKFFSKPEIYKGIHLDSSYESKVARELDANNILWERPSSITYFDDNGQRRRYLPDFYLPTYKVYLDPKNDWLIKKDFRKIQLVSEQNDITVLILDKDMLSWDKILTVL